MGAPRPTADVEAMTQVIFTDPEIAVVGLTAAIAEQRGLRVRMVDADWVGLSVRHYMPTAIAAKLDWSSMMIAT